ncbi:helix-turn-helix domain-containing protein [Acinetobacter johnsonii]|uniref:LexA family protein n=1 Tax=Acinetobacter johnsonii TaxID=40214 RepID=UPI001326CB5A|nr:S24 family peptidase [Acinetobacter johnsonii]MWC17557.1 helix-turn-helix domain-containing protein [Acinetobacter johnsonii]
MSFHLRLQEKLKEKGYKPADLARAAEVSGVAAGKWIHGDSQPKAGKLKLIARFLDVSDDWLLTGREASPRLDNNVDLSQRIPFEGRPVPVISWVAAGSFGPIATVLKDAEVDEYLPPIRECGKNGYGLVVTGISMSPKFEPEDRIYVNPDFQVSDLKTGDLVIVSCTGDNEATFKQLIIEGTTKYLKPLNPKWDEQIIKLTEDCRLVGKVVGLYRKI